MYHFRLWTTKCVSERNNIVEKNMSQTQTWNLKQNNTKYILVF